MPAASRSTPRAVGGDAMTVSALLVEKSQVRHRRENVRTVARRKAASELTLILLRADAGIPARTEPVVQRVSAGAPLARHAVGAFRERHPQIDVAVPALLLFEIGRDDRVG